MTAPAPEGLDHLPRPACSFASDNAAGAHPEVLAAVAAANEGPALAYGDDPWSRRGVEAIAELFGGDAEVALCWGGTGANVVGLQCLLGPGEAVLCHEGAHIDVDEGGAPERFTGSKLVTIPTADAKLRPADLEDPLRAVGNPHHAQPTVLSITQSTERGTLYQPAEVAAVVEAAHGTGWPCTSTGPASPTPPQPSTTTCAPSPPTSGSTWCRSGAPRTDCCTATRWWC